MMRQMQIIGNIVRDAEVFSTQTNHAVNFTVAVNETWKDRVTGEQKKKVTYIKCALWCKNPSISAHLKKGLKIYVDGTPETEAYIKDGVAISNLKLLARNVYFMSNKSNSPSSQETTPQSPASPSESFSDTLVPTPDDDLPF